MSKISNPKRPPRIIKNCLVHLDDVECLPGPNFINWVNITKKKLLERERKLIAMRIDAVKHALTTTIDKHNEQLKLNGKLTAFGVNNINTVLNMINMNEFIQPCIYKLEQNINGWDGTKSKKKEQFTVFRQYFRKSKNWFDQMKIKYLATYFWIPILKIIKQLYQTESESNEYTQYLHYSILLGLLLTKFPVPNSKKRLLICVGNYSPKLAVSKEMGVNYKIDNTKQKLSCTEIRELIVDELRKLQNNAMKAIANEQNNSIKPIKMETSTNNYNSNYNSNDNFNHTNTYTNTPEIVDVLPPKLFFNYDHDNANVNAPLCNCYCSMCQPINDLVWSIPDDICDYNGYHSVSQNVYTQRYNPI